MFNWKKIAILLLTGSVLCAFATNRELQLKAEQFKSKNGAIAQWDDGVLILKIDKADGSVSINPPAEGKFDFSNARYLACDVENLAATDQMRLTMHISSGERGKKSENHMDLPHRETNTSIALNPGEKRTMRIYLPHSKLFLAPGNGKNLRVLDTARINSIDFQLNWMFESSRKYLVDCRITDIRLEGEPESEKKITDSTDYFPFIDRYGQYIHSNWPEKIHSDADLATAYRRELTKLDATTTPAEWNRYGGWSYGPQLEATGHFRTEKYRGKWFFIDPEGRLFWSLGIDVMHPSTDAIQRNHPEWFAQDVPQNPTLPFTDWNLQKKYGKQDFRSDFFDILERRMTAWGINTIGSWAPYDFLSRGNKPYTVCLGEMVQGFPRFKNQNVKFYDVFDPEFETKMGNILRDCAEKYPLVMKSIDDPMCIGYFIDNELRFEPIVSATVKAEPNQPAKQEFIRGLKEKYGTIAALNKAWGSTFYDWNALAANRKEFTFPGYYNDAKTFRKRFVNRYFRICRDGIKSMAPHRLYLGCRFLGLNQRDIVWEAAAKYCDVVSANSYTSSIFNVNMKKFRDVPLLIGEFHFGTLDRGMFIAGLVPVGDQQEQAISFTRFVQGALVHPNLVGAHWFQLRDQPLTGRWDGEGYRIGFVDVADTPYPELCKAAREVGENMYRYRMNGKLVNTMK